MSKLRFLQVFQNQSPGKGRDLFKTINGSKIGPKYKRKCVLSGRSVFSMATYPPYSETELNVEHASSVNHVIAQEAGSDTFQKNSRKLQATF